MASVPNPRPNPRMSSIFQLEYPQSVGVYETYEEAQAAVDHLSDEQFPVENLCIVGTDLKSVERVLGRLTWGRVLLSGALNGVSMALLVGLLWLLFVRGVNPLSVVLSAIAFGVVIGAVFAAISHALTGGRRDFNSVTQTVATRYEVLSEHKVAAQARELLAQSPQGRQQTWG